MKIDEKYNIIKNAFSSEKNYLSNEIIEELISISYEVEFSKNDMILNMLEEQTEIYILLSGIARSYYLDKDGNDITKYFMKENDFCIGESLFSKEKSIQGFEALENIKALRFNAYQLKKLLLEYKNLTKIYIEYLEKNLIYKMQREYSFQIMSATERYINFQKEYKEIETRVNQSYIASYLGITPESLSRIRRTIKDEN
ncbi:Crp/Fnr family transcriptional regulator [Clostridium sp. LP20]|uniref:Crp/Fnr family transcriptional regulator n=1 Tax=Clostridium sp. LP20 TaxID=3418665 RepID=UPI003EE786CD